MKKLYIIVCLAFLILLSRMIFYFSTQKEFKDGERVSFATRLLDEPQVKFGRQQFRVRIGNSEKITIATGLKPVLQYGDKIKVEGVVSQNQYKGHIFTTVKTSSVQIDNSDQNFITRLATGIRRFAANFYQKNLPPVSASLLSGIVFGGNQGLSDKFLSQLRTSGVIHVIAASGMNVTFVAVMLISILGLFLRRQAAITIAILGVWFYAFLSGFEPSIVRATIMGIIAFSASFLGKQNWALVSLFLTSYIMLLISPNLLGDVGFQLSVLATLGILVVKPIVDGFFGKFGWLGKVGSDDVGTTIAAQVTTVPILLGTFGSYGLLSILVNALVLWTVPVLMVFGALALVLGAIFEPLGKIILFLTEPILFYFEQVVIYFGNFGWNLEVSGVSVWVTVGYYLLLSSAIFLIYQKRSQKSING